ncbi:MAG: TonB-dependent receptor [Thermodesulfobacteriota bacterium]
MIKRKKMDWRSVLIGLIIGSFSWGPALAGEASKDLTDLSLEALMNLSVTSVSKKEEKVSQAPSAVFVITQEDIRRSGATNVPEALRMVPGVEVARIDANKWAISARGFNSRFANKLLVLMDGRTLYANLFSGVFWDVQDTLIEDIERIEVIRGPGATLWGANAVNGVINIITKKARDVQGGLAVAGGGTEEKGFGGLRYGTKTGESSFIKAYAKFFDRAGSVQPSGEKAGDEWDLFRTGFRFDHHPSTLNNFTLQGDYYQGHTGTPYAFPLLTPPYVAFQNEKTEVSGGNILGRWKHVYSEASECNLQFYYDRTQRKDILIFEEQDVFDFDFQHRFRWLKRQEIVWGLGYRLLKDRLRNNDLLALYPSERTDQLFSAFIQDDIVLIKDQWRWVIGSKFEHNDYTGFEFQPSTRLIYNPTPTQTLWSAISRSVRTPSRVDQQLSAHYYTIIPGESGNDSPFPLMIRVVGNPEFQSEEVISYELGYRLQPLSNLNVDLTGYYNQYDRLRSASPGPVTMETRPSGPYLVSNQTVDNEDSAEILGLELALDWKIADWWQIKTAYTLCETRYHQHGAVAGEVFESPAYQVSLRSSFNLGKTIELDGWFRYVGELKNLGIAAYSDLDLRLAWHPMKTLELALVGQNLLKARRAEFYSPFFNYQTFEVERGFYAKVSWKF